MNTSSIGVGDGVFTRFTVCETHALFFAQSHTHSLGHSVLVQRSKALLLFATIFINVGSTTSTASITQYKNIWPRKYDASKSINKTNFGHSSTANSSLLNQNIHSHKVFRCVFSCLFVYLFKLLFCSDNRINEFRCETFRVYVSLCVCGLSVFCVCVCS